MGVDGTTGGGDSGYLPPDPELEQLVVQHSRDAVGILDTSGALVWISPVISRLLGWDPDDLVGRSAFELIHPDDLEVALKEAADALMRRVEIDPVTVRMTDPEGTWRPIEVAAGLVEGPDRVPRLVVNLRDVHWRTEAEEALRRSEERFRALLEKSSDVVVVIDAEGMVTYASPAVQTLYGVAPEDIVGTTHFGAVHPDDIHRVTSETGVVLDAPGASATVEARVRRQDGSWGWAEFSVTNLTDVEEVGGLVVHVRDTTDRREAESALREREQLFRLLAQASPMGIFQHDDTNGCVYVNDRWQEITGYSFEEVKGPAWRRIIHPDDRSTLGLDSGVPRRQRSTPFTQEFRVVRPSGETRWVSVRTSPIFDDDDALVGGVGVLEDITDQREVQRDNQRLIDVFNATNDLVGIAGPDGRLLYLNAAARRFFGLPDTGALESFDLSSVFTESAAELLTNDIQRHLETTGMWGGELSLRRADQESVPVLAQLMVHRDADGKMEFFSGVMHDISERKEFESTLAHQATHDPLTGLPNRSLLLERLDFALRRAERHKHRIAVLFVDLDHFKVVNDSLGHDLGDRLLVAIAERLKTAVRPGDSIARFGGDEFVVLCEQLHRTGDAVAIAERLLAAVSGPFVVDDAEVFIGMSIGIAFPEATDTEAGNLIRDADAAMYRAKERGRARWEIFDNDLRASAVDRLEIENALRKAVERRELRVFYQPVVSLVDGTVTGVEALLRWEHPERGLLLPGDFITIAEETGLIVPIGSFVIDQACRQVQRWHAALPDLPTLELSVNLSGRQLGHPSLARSVADALEASHIDPAGFHLEITESVLMDDVEASEEMLGLLHRLGVRLAVDDFGTGYSSLSYLRRFPVDVLKVDRSFVDGLGTDPSDSAIVAAIITLAHTLGLEAVAEGVETAGQLAELRRLGCDKAQGFYMARPGTAHDIGRLLERRPIW